MPNPGAMTVLQKQRRAAKIGFYIRLTVLFLLGAAIAWGMWFSPAAVKKRESKIVIAR